MADQEQGQGDQGQAPRNERARGPQDMQAVLRFCTELTKAEDTTRPSSHVPMDPERQAFLSEALRGMQVNVVENLKSCLSVLQTDAVHDPSEDIETIEVAIGNLGDYCEDVNNAMDVHKIGGFPIIIDALSSPHSSIRAGVASLVGDICQNCDYCQTHMLDQQILIKLLQQLDKDTCHQARIKALYAISCLIRQCKKGEEQFLELDGLSYLMRAMQTNTEKLIIKSSFLLLCLLRQNPSCQEAAISMGYVEQIVNVMKQEETSDFTHEHCSSIMSDMASNIPSVLEECSRPELALVELIQNRLAKIKGKEENMDEEQHLTQLLNLFPEPEADDSLNR